MKSDKHRWIDIVRAKKQPQRQSDVEHSHNRKNCRLGDCPRRKQQRHQLKDMDINDLKQYVLDTEYDPD